jgi:hypothetical protein
MKSMKLAGQLNRIADVTEKQRDEMFALMEMYYENMDRAVFESDLAEKDWIIQLVEPQSGVVRGFSTQMLIDLELQGRPVAALFSGDTIVDREYWGNNPLTQIWGRFALWLMDTNPGPELYWFLITKGYKTYRFLPVFFHEFYPRFDVPTPRRAQRLIDALGRHKFAASYDDPMGIVRAERFGCRLRPNVAEITPGRSLDPHVQFFAARNPGHERGDELCCIAPLTRANFRPAAYRAIGFGPLECGGSTPICGDGRTDTESDRDVESRFSTVRRSRKAVVV